MIVPTLTRRDFNKGNFGDSYICIGMQYLWEKAVGRPCQWLLLDKFDRGADVRQFEAAIKDAGFMVIAGTPQYNNLDDWSFWYDEGVWNQVIEPWNLKAFALAGGSGHPDPKMTPTEFAEYCAGSRRTARALRKRAKLSALTTVRDPFAAELLNVLGIENELMPCTATWATHKRGIKKVSDEYVLLVSPSAHHLSHHAVGSSTEEQRLQAPVDLMPRMYRVFKERLGKNPIVVCHGTEEYRLLRGKVPSEALWYSNDSHTTLELYARAELVVSCRLHGALPAFGVGNTKVHMIGIDTRGSAVSVFPQIGYSSFPDVLSLWGDSFVEFCKSTLELEPKSRRVLKASEDKYISMIRNMF